MLSKLRSVSWFPVIIGTGLALSPIHNLFLTRMATLSSGETLLFIPQIGYALLVMGSGIFCVRNWDTIKPAGYGSRYITIPLLIIVAAVVISGIGSLDLNTAVSGLGIGLLMITLYLSGRILGNQVYGPPSILSALAAFGIILHQVIFPGQVTGGFVFERNYDISVGYIITGALLCPYKRWRPALVVLSFVAVMLSGSPEGIFAAFVLILALFIRKDWSKRLVFATAIVIGVLVVWALPLNGISTYGYLTGDVIKNATVTDSEIEGSRNPLWYRVDVIRDEMQHIKPLGTGLSLTNFNDHEDDSGRLVRIVHNVPLILVQQLGYPGILAGIAWLFLSLYFLRKSKQKYIWTAVLALSVFDHFIWTQYAPLWPLLLGTALTAKADLIFKNNREESNVV